MKKQIKIDKPCGQSWDEMTPLATGQHFCSNCSRNIVDFTWMSDEEIVDYLLANTKVCGKFQSSQLNRPLILQNKKFNNLLFKIAAMITGVLFLTPASAQVEKIESVQTIVPVQIPVSDTSALNNSRPDNSKIIVTGKVLDEHNKRVKYANILILMNSDTSKRMTEIELKTNKRGVFSVELDSSQVKSIVSVRAESNGRYGYAYAYSTDYTQPFDLVFYRRTKYVMGCPRF